MSQFNIKTNNKDSVECSWNYPAGKHSDGSKTDLCRSREGQHMWRWKFTPGSAHVEMKIHPWVRLPTSILWGKSKQIDWSSRWHSQRHHGDCYHGYQPQISTGDDTAAS